MKRFSGHLLISRVSVAAGGEPRSWVVLMIHGGPVARACAVPVYSPAPSPTPALSRAEGETNP
jgi:hypothetical protein